MIMTDLCPVICGVEHGKAVRPVRRHPRRRRLQGAHEGAGRPRPPPCPRLHPPADAEGPRQGRAAAGRPLRPSGDGQGALPRPRPRRLPEHRLGAGQLPCQGGAAVRPRAAGHRHRRDRGRLVGRPPGVPPHRQPERRTPHRRHGLLRPRRRRRLGTPGRPAGVGGLGRAQARHGPPGGQPAPAHHGARRPARPRPPPRPGRRLALAAP